jgi:toxin CptA
VPLHRISVRPSVLIAIAVSIVHVAAAAVLWVVPVPAVFKAAVTLAIAVSLIYFMARDAALHAARSVVALELRDDGEIACQTRDGSWLGCELLGSSCVTPGMTVINLRLRGSVGYRRVILVPDNMDAEDFRRLRTWLRWRGETVNLDTVA